MAIFIMKRPHTGMIDLGYMGIKWQRTGTLVADKFIFFQ